MAKEQMKRAYTERQNRLCVICGEEVSEETALVDTDRQNPKASGGEYTDENTRIVHPVCHFKRHGIYRERSHMIEQLKSVIDDREQVRKVVMKVNNQLLAYERRTDHLNEVTKAWLEAEQKKLAEQLKGRDAMLVSQIKEIAKTDTVEGRVIKSALGVRGVGYVTIAYCIAYLDVTGVFPETQTDPKGKTKPHPRARQEKARHASSLWAYVGLDKPSHARYEKGKSGGGNKSLRTVLYTLAESQVKSRGAYRDVYDRTKDRLSQSEKTVMTRDTKGRLIESAWKEVKPSHRHGAALRAVMKHFLADLWMVWRTESGMETTPLYADAVLGGSHRTIMPTERGWIYG